MPVCGNANWICAERRRRDISCLHARRCQKKRMTSITVRAEFVQPYFVNGPQTEMPIFSCGISLSLVIPSSPFVVIPFSPFISFSNLDIANRIIFDRNSSFSKKMIRIILSSRIFSIKHFRLRDYNGYKKEKKEKET